ncbi:MAG: carbohydrate kinase family protein [Paludibacter sp.]|nr:carbohydrate kinase family protein [Paludibacter sp.]
MANFRVSGTGCALGDFVYNHIDFSSSTFKKYQSKQAGDGGLEAGKLVFTQELERFSGKNFQEILLEISGDRIYDAFNIGGPAIVGLINTAQLLQNTDIEVCFYGARSNDERGKAISRLIKDLPLNLENYRVLDGETPYTDVLSDPNFANGKGERTFVNNIACAAEFDENYLDENFWNSDIIVFGATAIVPKLHNNLSNLLLKAKSNGSLTVVHTVYDFINEKQHPEKPWPLGNTLESLALIDLLVMDYEESLRISGCSDIISTQEFFIQNGCNAFLITHGAQPTYVYSSGKLFQPIDTTLPVCEWINDDFAHNPHLKGDTTGCGDNFVGGVVANIVSQLESIATNFSLIDATILGTVCGGFACYYVGGTFFEKYSGEKSEKVNEMLEKYKLTNKK